MRRLARLAAGLDDPLLVTHGVNVRYLTGFQSSNTAVLVIDAAGGDSIADQVAAVLPDAFRHRMPQRPTLGVLRPWRCGHGFAAALDAWRRAHRR